ncbi:MAG: hypothetical protein ABJF04_06320 [Reichenbachiella sp.]|uniref:hypothetical protein n=1 Tax=Reichenbachiella sp. TaxID=2184521 RepID=UPI003263B311
MEFKFIDDVIDNIQLGLEVLEKDADNYTMLLFQHKGVFSIDDDKFGNEKDCSSKFSSFIELAKTENVSLALTPEYSCPWDSIVAVVEDQEKWPNNSKLWALCCESIKPDEISAFQQTHANDNVLIHFDEEALNHGGGGVLLDPICYVFKAKVGQVEKLVVLVQFKTQHMGVWDSPLEREKYIPGREVYVLRNSPHSIYLFTNICSEAENFDVTDTLRDEFRWDEHPYIILSPQMNPKPTHEVFKTYRRTIIAYSHKDIISLNWAGTTALPGMEEPLIPLSKSSIVFKTSDVDFENENRFINNHNKGLYYLNKKANTHAYYFNPYEEVFLISNQKPSSAGVNGALIRRTGPEVRNVFAWNDDNVCFTEIDQVEDGFIDFLSSLNCANATFQNMQISFIDKERLVNLSYGKASAKKDDKRWYRLDKLETFVQDENEGVNRLTYVHDESSAEIRRAYIECIDCLNDVIIPDEELFPENLIAFKGNCGEVMFYQDGGYNYKYNLVTSDAKHRATVAYIGRNNEGSALKILRQLQNLFDKEDQSKKLVVVWYKENATDIKPVCEVLPPSVNDDSTVDPISISNV